MPLNPVQSPAISPTEEPAPSWSANPHGWINWIDSDWFEKWLQLARHAS